MFLISTTRWKCVCSSKLHYNWCIDGKGELDLVSFTFVERQSSTNKSVKFTIVTN